MAVATNLGTGGSALDAQYGSSSGSNTNEPLLLTHTGENYVYLPGTANDFLSVPAFSQGASNVWDIRVRVAMDDWTPGSGSSLWASGSADPNRAPRFTLSASGALSTTLYPTGNNASVISISSSATNAFTNGTTQWVRVTIEGDVAGSYNVKFFTADDSTTMPTSWTQLGTTRTGTGFTNATVTSTMNTAAGGAVAGKFLRIWQSDAINGTAVVDIDIPTNVTSGNTTTFTATTGQTVTIGRATSGRKSAAVVRPMWLLGTDDYFEVADNSLLDFAAADDWTVWVVGRAWGTTDDDTLIAKQAGTAAANTGWALDMGTAGVTRARIADGTTTQNQTTTARTSGALTLWAAVKSGSTLTPYLGSTAGTPLTITVAGTLANSEVMRIGRLAGAGTNYADVGIMAAAVHRRALTSTELAAIAAYYGA